MLLTRKMWDRFQAKWDERWTEIAGNVKTLNHEYGKIQTSVKWVSWLVGVLLIAVLGIAGAVIQSFVAGP